MLIDRISYRNSIKNINPIIKIFLAFIVLILILVTNNIELFIFNFIAANCIMLFIIKVKIKELVQLYAIQMFFILTTI
nr:cobalt ABC transporter permease [Leptotrichiaceae bacterium]